MYVIKALIVLTVLGMGTAAAADTAPDTAATFRLDPVSTDFTASGQTTLHKGFASANCTADFTGATDAQGGGSVSAASFSGGSLCSGISGAGFPWAISPTSLTAVTIHNVAVNTQLGACGPSDLSAAADNNKGTLTFNNAMLSGGCTISGTLTTSPKITIVQQ